MRESLAGSQRQFPDLLGSGPDHRLAITLPNSTASHFPEIVLGRIPQASLQFTGVQPCSLRRPLLHGVEKCLHCKPF